MDMLIQNQSSHVYLMPKLLKKEINITSTRVEQQSHPLSSLERIVNISNRTALLVTLQCTLAY